MKLLRVTAQGLPLFKEKLDLSFLCAAKSCGKQRIDTVRLKLLKIAAKVVRSARYITFKLCSSCPYKSEFYETISNIGNLNVQLE